MTGNIRPNWATTHSYQDAIRQHPEEHKQYQAAVQNLARAIGYTGRQFELSMQMDPQALGQAYAFRMNAQERFQIARATDPNPSIFTTCAQIYALVQVLFPQSGIAAAAAHPFAQAPQPQPQNLPDLEMQLLIERNQRLEERVRVLEEGQANQVQALAEATARALAAEEERDRLRQALEAMTHRFEGAETERNQIALQLAELRPELRVARETIATTQEELRTTQQRLHEFEQRNEELVQEAAQHRTQLALNEAHARTQDATIGEQTTRINDLTRLLDEARETRANVDQELQQARAQVRLHEAGIATLTQQLGERQRELETLRPRLEEVQGELMVANLRAERAEGRIGDLEARLEGTTTDRDTIRAELQQARTELREMEADRRAFEAQGRALQEQITHLTQLVDTDRRDLEAERETVATLRRENGTLQEQARRAIALEAQLGELQQINREMRTTNAELNQELGVAREIVNMTRANFANAERELEAARARLAELGTERDALLLNRQQAQERVQNLEREIARRPEPQELIRVEAELRTAREALISTETNAAAHTQEIARLTQEVTNLTQDRTRLTQLTEGQQGQIATLERESAVSRVRLEQNQQDLTEAQAGLARLQTQQEVAQRRIQTLEQELTIRPQREDLTRADRELHQAGEALIRAEANATAHTQEIERLKQQITTLTEEKARLTQLTEGQQGRIGAFERESTESRARLEGNQRDLAHAQAQLTRLQTQHQTAQRDIQKFQEELREARAVQRTLQGQVDERIGTITNLTAELAAQKRIVAANEQQLNALRPRVEELAGQNRTLTQERNQSNEELRALRGQFTVLNAEVNTLKEQNAIYRERLTNADRSEEEKRVLKEQLQLNETKIQELERESANSARDLAVNAEKLEALTNERNQLARELAPLRDHPEQLAVAETKITQLEAEITRIKREQRATLEANTSLQQRVDLLTTRATELERNLSLATESRERIAEDLASGREKNTELVEELRLANERIFQLTPELATVTEALSNARREVEQVQELLREVKQEKYELEARIETFQREGRDKDQGRIEAETSLREATRAITRLEAELDLLKEENANYPNQIEALTKQLDQLKDQLRESEAMGAIASARVMALEEEKERREEKIQQIEESIATCREQLLEASVSAEGAAADSRRLQEHLIETQRLLFESQKNEQTWQTVSQEAEIRLSEHIKEHAELERRLVDLLGNLAQNPSRGHIPVGSSVNGDEIPLRETIRLLTETIEQDREKISDLEREAQRANNRSSGLEAELENLIFKLDEAHAHSAQLEEENLSLNRQNSDLTEALEKEKGLKLELEARIDILEEEIEIGKKREEEATNLALELISLREQLKAQSKTIEEQKAYIEEQSFSILDQESSIEQIEGKLAELQGFNKALKWQLLGAKLTNHVEKEERLRLQQKVDASREIYEKNCLLQEQLHNAFAHLSEMENEKGELESLVRESEGLISALTVESEARLTAVQEIRARCDELTAKLGRRDKTLKERNATIQELQNLLHSQQQLYSDREAEVVQLQMEKPTQENQNRILQLEEENRNLKTMQGQLVAKIEEKEADVNEMIAFDTQIEMTLIRLQEAIKDLPALQKAHQNLLKEKGELEELLFNSEFSRLDLETRLAPLLSSIEAQLSDQELRRAEIGTFAADIGFQLSIMDAWQGSLQKHIENLQSEYQEAQIQLIEYEKRFEECRITLSQMQAGLTDLGNAQKEKKQLENQIIELQKGLALQKMRVKELETLKNGADARLARIAQGRAEALQTIEALSSELATTKEQLEEAKKGLETDKIADQEKVQALEDKLRKLEQANQKIPQALLEAMQEGEGKEIVIRTLQAQLESYQARSALVLEAMEKLNDESNTMRSLFEETEEAYRNALTELTEKEEMGTKQAKIIEELRKEIEQLQEKKRLMSPIAEKGTPEYELIELKAKLATSKEEKKHLQQELEARTLALTLLSKEHQRIEEKLPTLSQNLEEEIKSHDLLQTTIAQLETQVKTLSKEKERLRHSSELLIDQEDLQKELDSLSFRLTKASLDLEGARHSLDTTKKEKLELEKELDETLSKQTELELQLSELRQISQGQSVELLATKVFLKDQAEELRTNQERAEVLEEENRYLQQRVQKLDEALPLALNRAASIEDRQALARQLEELQHKYQQQMVLLDQSYRLQEKFLKQGSTADDSNHDQLALLLQIDQLKRRSQLLQMQSSSSTVLELELKEEVENQKVVLFEAQQEISRLTSTIRDLQQALKTAQNDREQEKRLSIRRIASLEEKMIVAETGYEAEFEQWNTTLEEELRLKQQLQSSIEDLRVKAEENTHLRQEAEAALLRVKAGQLETASIEELQKQWDQIFKELHQMIAEKNAKIDELQTVFNEGVDLYSGKLDPIMDEVVKSFGASTSSQAPPSPKDRTELAKVLLKLEKAKSRIAQFEEKALEEEKVQELGMKLRKSQELSEDEIKLLTKHLKEQPLLAAFVEKLQHQEELKTKIEDEAYEILNAAREHIGTLIGLCEEEEQAALFEAVNVEGLSLKEAPKYLEALQARILERAMANQRKTPLQKDVMAFASFLIEEVTESLSPDLSAALKKSEADITKELTCLRVINARLIKDKYSISQYDQKQISEIEKALLCLAALLKITLPESDTRVQIDSISKAIDGRIGELTALVLSQTQTASASSNDSDDGQTL